MNENTTNNAIVLNQDSTPEEYAKILRGRYITDIATDGEIAATITLDNGTALELIGSWGCSCGNGVTYIKHVFQRGGRNARIMNARVEATQNDERYYETDYTIFVMIDGNPSQLPLATMQGYDENGYYGTGFTIYARPTISDNTNTSM
jgi:hypothetical protein